jgi:hypothetical protein
MLSCFSVSFVFANRNIKSSVEPKEDIIRYAEEEDDTVGEVHDCNFGVNFYISCQVLNFRVMERTREEGKKVRRTGSTLAKGRRNDSKPEVDKNNLPCLTHHQVEATLD